MDIKNIEKLELPLELITSRDLNEREMIMLAVIAKLCQRTAELVGAFFIKLSNEELRRIVGKSERTVQRTLASLKAKGFIKLQYFEMGDTRKIIHLKAKTVELMYGMKNYDEPETV